MEVVFTICVGEEEETRGRVVACRSGFVQFLVRPIPVGVSSRIYGRRSNNFPRSLFQKSGPQNRVGRRGSWKRTSINQVRSCHLNCMPKSIYACVGKVFRYKSASFLLSGPIWCFGVLRVFGRSEMVRDRCDVCGLLLSAWLSCWIFKMDFVVLDDLFLFLIGLVKIFAYMKLWVFYTSFISSENLQSESDKNNFLSYMNEK